MYSGNASSSFLSMAANIHGDQPLHYGHYSNIRMDRDDTMDIDGWIYEMRPQSDIAMSYSSSGEPPSLGDLRKIVVSEPSDSNLMYSDGQPPSINDVGRREPSQSEASCNRFEDPDANEVQQPHISEIGVEKNRVINPELWQACAGPLVNLPASGTHVVYFPQGHCEQVAASMKNGGDAQIPNYPNLESKLLCHLHNVTLHVDTETDEVYAQMTLQPVPSFNKEALLNSHPLRKTQKPQTEIFCKTLTESDMNIHGDFSVPHLAAENIFPALDFFMQPPTQELVVTDLHENVWKFRHIYHGQLKRHLLTTGWSSFVSGKRLFPGDSVLFIRDKHGRLLLGVRRANRQPANLSSVLSTYNMHIGILAAAAHAAANNRPFNVFYNPRASPSEFVIPLYKYCKAVYSNQISLGIRFRMMFETKESGTRSYMGKIIDISDLDNVRWKNSQWRNLKVGWDEATTREDRTHISVWEIEPVTTRFFMQPPTQGMLGDESEKFENLYQRKMPWLGENMSLEDPGPNLGQWMNMLQTNQFQPNHVNPLAGMVLQDHVAQDLHRNQQLQKPPQQLTDLTQQTARQNMINQTVQHLSAMQNLESQLWNQKMVRNQAVLQPPIAILDPVSAIKTRYSKTEQYTNDREKEPWKSNHLNHPFGTDLKIIARNVNRF